jgi:hypothetical protein
MPARFMELKNIPAIIFMITLGQPQIPCDTSFIKFHKRPGVIFFLHEFIKLFPRGNDRHHEFLASE